ncbi:MAG: Hsp70 family protein [Defluviitaleaceae bacterium]|nr:Hsp70 family protein [Defluviitaleaceae bacterium]
MKIGIDFGTSTSEAAFVDEHGKINVVPNHAGELITPSIVYVADDGRVVVGREAKEMAVLEPGHSVFEVKRMFGQDTKITLREKEYSPADIAAMIIGYLVDCAKAHCGCEIDSAVITVPAYFTDAQRREVMAAGQACGLEVSRIINEPTAASLDYGIDHLRDCKYMLVYDLGGGTLDVTVLELFEGVVDVKSSCGNNALGGKDFDQALIDHITASIKRRDKVDITRDLRAMVRVKLAAEACKIALSEDIEHTIELPFLYTDKAGSPAGFSEKVSRTTFETMIADKIDSTQAQIKTVLFDAGLEAHDIDLVLTVGGSTRIPYVSSFLLRNFGFVPEAASDPDMAVVRGAAIQAGVLSGMLPENAIVLTDICPYSLSTGVLRHSGFLSFIACDTIIPRNTVLPALRTKMYTTSYDYQSKVHITAYQGESEEPGENLLLNTFALSGIPRGKAGREDINISFEYDLNGILIVSAEVASTGKSATVTVDTSQVGGNLDLSLWGKSPLAKKYRKIVAKSERLAKIHGSNAADVENAAGKFKRALVLEWDEDIVDRLARELSDAIEDLEDSEH